MCMLPISFQYSPMAGHVKDFGPIHSMEMKTTFVVELHKSLNWRVFSTFECNTVRKRAYNEVKFCH